MGLNSIEFHRRFQSDDDCLEYLSELKWSDNLYNSRKCSSDRYYKGRTQFSRRGIKCGYDESVTAYTAFEKCKFSLLVTFHIVFKINTKVKGMSSRELSNDFDLRKKTCWTFKRKVQECITSSRKHKIVGQVHIDEFYIGQYEENKIGRATYVKKKLVIVALKILNDGVG